MQQTIFAILTNEETRKASVVETALDQEFQAGVPWFSKTLTEPPNINTNIAA